MSADVKTPSKLEKILASGEMAVTSECGPPRGSDPDGIKEKAEMIRDYVDAINITDYNRNVTARFLIDVDCYFAHDTFVKRATPFDRLRDSEPGRPTLPVSSASAIRQRALFVP